eukprot:GILJ01004275.1.p1 GENE.GILJ01004275.1~~GILJ01004275.1.p1  ORF type:complete len:647 (+),score=74.74 GILJ01004275.1:60-2000(+)
MEELSTNLQGLNIVNEGPKIPSRDPRADLEKELKDKDREIEKLYERLLKAEEDIRMKDFTTAAIKGTWTPINVRQKGRPLKTAEGIAKAKKRLESNPLPPPNPDKQSAIMAKHEIMVGFDLQRSADICTAIWTSVKELKANIPSINPNIPSINRNTPKKAKKSKVKDKVQVGENTVVHGFLKRIFNGIEQVANNAGRCVNKRFYEYQATTATGKRPDWLFTGPKEQEHAFINTLFFLEAKAPAQLCNRPQGDSSNSVARPEDTLLDEALFQCIKHIGDRHAHVNRKSSFGIGIATNGCNIQFVRINFVRDVAHGLFPCYVSPKLSLFGDPASTPSDCPEGMQWLIHLMLENDPQRFGLPEHILPDPLYDLYKVGPLLGSGGFGNVFQVSQDENHYACKTMRNHVKSNYLQHEADCLEALQGLPHVPRLVNEVRDANNQVVALVMEPVGEPLRQWVANQDRKSSHFDDCIGHILNQLVEIVRNVHSKGWVHEDIRPSNIIISSLSDTALPNVTLIDWGLAAKIGTTRENHFGEAGFLSRDRLTNWVLPYSVKADWEVHISHDLEALALTVLSMTDNCRPFDICSCDDIGYVEERKGDKWIKKHVDGILGKRNTWIDQRLSAVQDVEISNKLKLLLGRQVRRPKAKQT